MVSKKASHCPGSSRFLPMLSSRSFIAFHFTLKSMIHIELILMKGVKSVASFIFFFAYGYPIVSDPFVKEMIFFPLYCLLLFCQISVDYMGVYSWAFHSVPPICLLVCLHACMYLLEITHCLHFCSLIGNLGVGWHQSTNFALQYCVGYSGSLPLSINFRIGVNTRK